MKWRFAFQVLVAITTALLLVLPATSAQAAGHGKFRPVLIGRTGTVSVKALPSRGQSAAHRNHPFLGLAGVPGHQPGSASSAAAPVVEAAVTGTTEEVLSKFQAVTLDQQLSLGADQFVTPPDNGLAVGPDYVVEMVNDSGTIWDKSGNLVKIFDLNKFFAVPSGYTFSDPRILYDQVSQRWFASGVAFIAPSYGSGVTIAVSTGSDPSGTWVQYLAANSSNVTHDQPKIGVSSDKVVLSWNDFVNAQFFQGGSTWIFEKSQMVAGASSVNGAALGPDSSRAALVPAVQLSSNSAEYIVYNNSDCSTLGCNKGTPTLGVAWITGTPLGSNLAWNEADPGMPATSQPPNADQPGMPGSIATNDDRLLTAVWQNGVLWTGGNDGCLPPNDSVTRPCSRLIQVSTSGPTITQDFDIASTGGGLYYPALAIDGGNNMYVVYNTSSTSQFVGVRITGELASSPPQTLVAAQTIRAGDATYDMSRCFLTSGASRWGDYSGAAIDPQNPTDIWVAAEYAAIGTATTPASDAGCAWGTFAGRLTFSGPSVVGISPATEQAGGPTNVTVTGTDFSPGATVNFGANAAAGVTVTSPKQLIATAPPGCGTVDVTVTTPDGTSAVSAADQFTYLSACGGGGATLTSISPTSGPAAGGTVVTLNGTGFVSASTTVNFGSNAGTSVSCSSTQCQATSPAGAGSVTVTVIVGGVPAIGSATFLYTPAASSLTSISPTSGPAAGGTVVTLSGSGFVSGSTTVSFGPNAATNVSCSSSTQCRATSPAGVGNVTVAVTVNGLRATGSVTFTYVPSLNSISPSSGTPRGGTTVTITGSGFDTTPSATRFFFGSNAATNVSCASSTRCTAVTPAGPRTTTVAVTVVVDGRAGSNSLSFKYLNK
jgi:IPT/TIG domain